MSFGVRKLTKGIYGEMKELFYNFAFQVGKV